MSDISSRRLVAMPGLLDDGLLTGQHETSTVLRPERCARPVGVDDLDAALAELEIACQVWGGGSQPLVPVIGHAVPAAYEQLLCTQQIDIVGGQLQIDVDLPRRVEARHTWNHPVVLVAASEPLERWPTIEVVELDHDDPWRPAYYGVLGFWPVVPNA